MVFVFMHSSKKQQQLQHLLQVDLHVSTTPINFNPPKGEGGRWEGGKGRGREEKGGGGRKARHMWNI